MTSPHAIDREEVMAYLDGELPAERVTLVRLHLDTCESCRHLAADLRDVSARLHQWQVEPSPAVLDVTVRAALEASPLVTGSPGSPRSGWRAFFVLPAVRFAGMTAVAASVVVAGWVILRSPDRLDTAPVPAPASITASSEAPAPRLEPPAGTPEPARATPNAVGEQRSRVVAGGSPSSGVVAAPPRLDAIGEVKVTQQGQPAVLAPPSDPLITNPPLSRAVPTTPPPPRPAAPPAATAPPAVTQTATAARGETFRSGAGAGGRGGGAVAADARAITVDSSRSAVETAALLAANRPLVARRAELTIVATQFDQARTDFDRIVAEQQGIAATLKTSGDAGQTRAIDAVIRIPAERVDAAIKSLRGLGRVTRDTQASDDLQIQIAAVSSTLTTVQNDENALRDQLVRQRTDREAVLITEQALARAREDRARLETELRTLYGRVTHGELTIRIEESR